VYRGTRSSYYWPLSALECNLTRRHTFHKRHVPQPHNCMVNANTYVIQIRCISLYRRIQISAFAIQSNTRTDILGMCDLPSSQGSDEVLLHCTLPQFAHVCRFRLCLYAFGRLQQRHTLSTRCYSIRWQTTWHDRNRPTRYCVLYRKLLRRTPSLKISITFSLLH
jgi:hypothetical protein